MSSVAGIVLGGSGIMIADYINHMITADRSIGSNNTCNETLVIPTDPKEFEKLLDEKGLTLGIEDGNCPVRIIDNPPFF